MSSAGEMLIQDARFSGRMLRKRPGSAILAIATLALAVGVGTAVFSIVNAILIQPLPYRDSHRLVMLWNVNEKAGFDLHQQRMMGRSLSLPEFGDWQQQTEIFERVLLFGSYLTRVGRNENPEMAMGYRAGPGLFTLLGMNPMLGRGFTPEDDAVGAENVIVLLHHFWMRRFGGDPGVLGQKLYLGALPYTIVGVCGPEFVFFNRMVDFVVPGQWATPQASGQARASRFLRAMARLSPGLSLAEAQARADAVSAELASRHPENKDWRVVLVPVIEESAGVIRPAMRALLVAVGCVLLIGCVNVTNLLLVEATVRAKELTVRSALGATRFQLIRLLVTHSLALAAIGGVAGFALAYAIIRYFQAALPDRFSHMKFLLQLEAIRIDGSVVLFAAGMIVFAGLVSGLVPAWGASRTDVNRTLKDSGPGSVGGSQARTLRNTLVVAQVAIAVLLVVGAVLLARSMTALYARGPGFRPDNLLSMEVAIPWEHIQEEMRTRTFASNQERMQYQRERFGQAARSFRERLAVELAAVPGVTGYAVTNVVPLSSYYQLVPIGIEGREAGEPNPPVALFNAAVSEPFFKLLGLPLHSGRFFGGEDRAGGLPVAIVSAEFARRYFSGQDPLGKRIKIGGARANWPWATIVGTVGDVNEDGLDRPPQPYVYQYEAQYDFHPRYLIVQSPLKPVAILPAVQRAVRNVEPNATIYRVVTLSDLARNSVWRVYYSALLLGGLALLAFVMALVGVYGVLSYTVRERTREIGVRIALGADRGDVIAMVVRHGLRQVGLGVVVGLGVALGLTQFLRTLLYGVGAFDFATFAGVAAGLLMAGLLAAYLPAQRAARLDPVKALRYE